MKACETVDRCAKTIVEAALEAAYATIIIADHGNSETMINPDGSPNTAHTTNPVPIIVVDSDCEHVSDGILGDIAPTILDFMGVPKPAIMTGKSLI
jgi:2,3-bisphosphoglycerate-independent phosphoglycerate mutase